jgi:hypothetical protein
MSDQLQPALAPLAPLLGEWIVDARFPAEYDLPTPSAPPTTTFAPILGGAFVLQRAEVPGIPEAPDVHAVIAARPDGTFLQHYFDSRGVVRAYDMTFAGGVWTLERFGPENDFAQRYVGRLSGDGRIIEGMWEIERDGALVPDFGLDYRRR